MDSIVLEAATAATVNAAAQLLSAQFDEHGIEFPPAKRLGAIAGLVDDPTRGSVLLARDRACTEPPELVGLAVAVYCWTMEQGGLVAWLDELYVVPALRGRGIGGALLSRAMGDARAAGAGVMELEVDEGHARAANLYRRAGFGELPRKRCRYRSLPLPREARLP